MMLWNLLVPMSDSATYAIYQAVCITLIIAMLVASVAAIILVLVQPSNSDGVDALGGGSSDTFFGKNKGKSTESVLKKWTVICLIVLAVLAIAFFIIGIAWH